MSAYVVEDSTINKVVSFLAMNRDAKYLIDRLGIDLSTSKAQAKFARELFRLNVEAVHQRYPDDAPDGSTFWYKFEIPSNKVRTYKALTCLMYQCSEGNIPETPLFKKLEEIQQWLAHEIVCELPEYDKAAWG